MTEAEILRNIEGLEPRLQRAYLDQIRSVVDAATIAEIERLIEQQDERGVSELMYLGVFAALMEASRAAYMAGATSEKVKPPRSGAKPIEFDVNQPEAQADIQKGATDLLEEISSNQREAISVTMRAGLNRGQTARETALDIIGRVNAQTGNRSGGVIGLAGNDAQAIARATEQLMSGDLVQLRQYLTRADRDKRLDGIIHESIETGKPVSKADTKRIIGRYADRKLEARAQMIAQSEAHKAYNAGWNRLYAQLLQQDVPPGSVEKIWRSKGDEKVRHSHALLNGQRVPFNQPFQSPKGAQMMFPGDDSLGAGWDELAHCRCTVSYRVKRAAKG